MAIKPDVNYVGKITPGGASYPYGSARNVTVPGDGTGTPFEQAWVNDLFGFEQKLLNAAGIVPSGNAETILASDYFNALEKLFSRYRVFTDTGVADAVQLAAASGANPSAYVDGQEVEFFLNNTITGPATIQIAALGAESFTLPGGTAFVGGEIMAGENVRARYDLANTRYELVSELSKVGKIEIWPLDVAPPWGLICDGVAVSRATYANLFARIGITYGNGDGATTFNTPDYRGEFHRMKDGGAGIDPDAAGRTDRGDGTTGDNVGTKQVDEFKSHTHSEVELSSLSAGAGATEKANEAAGVTGATGGNETRPINTYVNYVIRTIT